MNAPAPQPLLSNLEPRYYVDPAIFERERQAIFRHAWQLAGPESKVAAPGQYLAVELAGWKVFLLRGKDGVLRAFHNACRHRGARILEEGSGRCDLLRCPYHLWIYGEDGRLAKAPWFGEDPGFRVEDWGLEPVAVDTWRGLVFVSIDPRESLIEQLGDLPEEVEGLQMEGLLPLAAADFEMRSNWKTYTDNFVEGYHIPGIHPGFIRVIEFAEFRTVARRNVVVMTAPQKGGSIYAGKWLWMWPNWTLSLFPGGMNTSRIDPTSVDRCRLLYNFYFADDSPDGEAERQRTVETNCGIVREDFGICEHTQRNYASGAYRPGPLSPRHEQGVAWFQRQVRAHLEGEA